MHIHVIQGDWLVLCDEIHAAIFCMSLRISKDKTKAQITLTVYILKGNNWKQIEKFS